MIVVGAMAGLVAIVAVTAGGRVSAFEGMFRADALAALFKAVCVMALAFTALMSESFFSHVQKRLGEYYCLAVCLTLGMCVMASAGDLNVLYQGLELMALPIYAMAALRTGNNRSDQAAIKCFLMGSLPRLCYCLVCACYMGLPGTQRLRRSLLHCRLRQTGRCCPPRLLLWPSCWQAGDSRWLPRPSLVTVFMSVAAKAASLAVLARVLVMALPQKGAQWSGVLAYMAALTMLLGNLLL